MVHTGIFIVNSIALGTGLAMDAFSVSLANGLREPEMSRSKMALIAGTYGFFQALMPLTGWFLVKFAVRMLRSVEPLIPWIGFALLLMIGGKMLLEGVEKRREAARKGAGENGRETGGGTHSESSCIAGSGEPADSTARADSIARTDSTARANSTARTDSAAHQQGHLTLTVLLLQGIATSIDALSVGFAIAEYTFVMAVSAALLIAATTFVICTAGLLLGRKWGTKLSGEADMLGGIILILIGIQIALR